jgi:2-phosphoglycerate kinase
MIFLLGGPPRVGKSLISSEIRRRHAVSVVSTDALGAALENVLGPEAAPDLYVLRGFAELPLAQRLKSITEDPAALIDCARRESYVVWRAVEAYVARENGEGRDLLVEGVAVLPELIGRIVGIPHQVVFVGNQGEDHKENIRRFADEHEHDWMRGASDQYVDAFSVFVSRMSAYIEQEAKKYGFQYIAMDKRSLDDVVEEVARSLGLSGGQPSPAVRPLAG